MNEELQNYIRQMKEAGNSDEQIKQVLKKTGWSEEAIYSELNLNNNFEGSAKPRPKRSKKKLIIIIVAAVAVFGLVGIVFGAFYSDMWSLSQDAPEKEILEEDQKEEGAILKTEVEQPEVVGVSKREWRDLDPTNDVWQIELPQIDEAIKKETKTFLENEGASLLVLFNLTTPVLFADLNNPESSQVCTAWVKDLEAAIGEESSPSKLFELAVSIPEENTAHMFVNYTASTRDFISSCVNLGEDVGEPKEDAIFHHIMVGRRMGQMGLIF